MIKKNKIKSIYLFFIILFVVFFINNNNAKEILIYADDISYDNNENIIAKGSAKIFQDNQFILSDIIIYDKKNEKIILPSTFILKDDKNVNTKSFIHFKIAKE